MSQVLRASLSAVVLSLFALGMIGCGERFLCCGDGVIETCTCPPGELCMRAPFADCGDGTCFIEGECDAGDDDSAR
jgi:hypothetical protein